MTDQKITLLKEYKNKLPAAYIGELAKVSSEKDATSLTRTFFTYQHLYDTDAAADNKNKLGDCSISSIMTCLMVSAKTGLWPDPVTNYIYYIPKGGGIAKPNISYQGLVKLMSESEKVKLIDAEVVREGETLDMDTLKHTRSIETLDNPIVAAYAFCKFDNGEILKCIIGDKELAKIQKCAPYQGVWEKWPGEMKKKAALRRLSKMALAQLPELSKKLQAALEAENADYDLGRTIDHDHKPGHPDQLIDILDNFEKEENFQKGGKENGTI